MAQPGEQSGALWGAQKENEFQRALFSESERHTLATNDSPVTVDRSPEMSWNVWPEWPDDSVPAMDCYLLLAIYTLIYIYILPDQ